MKQWGESSKLAQNQYKGRHDWVVKLSIESCARSWNFTIPIKAYAQTGICSREWDA